MDRRSLTYRVLTAVVGIPLLLGAAWLGGWWWAFVVAVLAAVAAGEYLRLYPELGTWLRALTIVGVYVMIMLRWWVRILAGGGDQGFAVLVASWSMMLYALAILPVVLAGDPARTFNPRRPSDASGWGILYIGLSAAALVEWGFGAGFAFIVWFFVVVWANDIGAYFAGFALGKHKLSPQLSPGKTWEGAVFGLIAGSVTAWALASYLGLTGGQAVIIGLLISVAAQLGDLFESAIKRRAGVKDSGVLFPGHGGVLDRFDGVFAAAPVAYLLLHWWAP